jgi:thiol:disulfide interchange protein DsbC
MNKLNKIITIVASFLFILSIAGVSRSAGEAGEKKSVAKASEENVPTKDDALSALKELAPDIKILEVKPSPVAGLWEVDVESGGKKVILYLDSSKKYMIQGAIVDLRAKSNLTQERYNEINKVDVSKIPLDNAIVMGDKEAKHRVIVFDDPE